MNKYFSFIRSYFFIVAIIALAVFAALPTYHAKAFDSSAFVTTWVVDSGDTITIPTFSGDTYSYTVNWGDGTTDATMYTGDASHTYTGI